MSSPSDGGMPGTTFVERRRFPRIEPGPQTTMVAPIVVQAEMIDISSSGALVNAATSLAVGQRAQLRMLLANVPFSAWVEVVRAEPDAASGGSRSWVGFRFTALDERSEQALHRFVRDPV